MKQWYLEASGEALTMAYMATVSLMNIICFGGQLAWTLPILLPLRAAWERPGQGLGLEDQERNCVVVSLSLSLLIMCLAPCSKGIKALNCHLFIVNFQSNIHFHIKVHFQLVLPRGNYLIIFLGSCLVSCTHSAFIISCCGIYFKTHQRALSFEIERRRITSWCIAHIKNFEKTRYHVESYRFYNTRSDLSNLGS